jgi:hypothetical protein
MKTKYTLIAVSVIILVTLVFIYNRNTNLIVINDDSNSELVDINIKDANNKKEIKEVKKVSNVKQITEPVQPEEKYFGDLTDVSKGNANGVATASFKDDQYQIVARFHNLPEPTGTDFYEGWIVRKGLNFDVISTGKAIKENGEYINVFSSEKDLTDHTFYVLTIEPDDGDPAPAGHILEGTLKLK